MSDAWMIPSIDSMQSQPKPEEKPEPQKRIIFGVEIDSDFDAYLNQNTAINFEEPKPAKARTIFGIEMPEHFEV